MSEDLDKLKRDYQAISAPPFLATRIRAIVGESTHRRRYWKPAAVLGTAILALIWMRPGDQPDVPSQVATPMQPSLSSLAALRPPKPEMSSPSLSQLKSVSVPSLPAKPAVTNSMENTESRVLKEKNDAHI